MNAPTPQPFFASVARAAAALAAGGQPLPADDAAALERLARQGDRAAVMAAETLLDRHTLLRVSLDPRGHGVVTRGGAAAHLVEQGWTQFLLRIENTHGFEGPLLFTGGRPPISGRFNLEQRAALLDTALPEDVVRRGWLDARMKRPILSGFAVEYLVLDLFARDCGVRTGRFTFAAGDQSNPRVIPSIWHKAAWASFTGRGADVEFECRPSRDVRFAVRDDDGQGCVASFTLRDEAGRVYPSQALRVAPDMSFHAQIYRGHGESVRLPDGRYDIESWRGPEYVRTRHSTYVCEASPRIEVALSRWIDPRRWGWYSGDTHIHAAGCSHFMHPTQGVAPETMIRQVRGEALAVGQVLTWGPAWYHQRQFFSARAISPDATVELGAEADEHPANLVAGPTAKDGESLLRYDVEVSGFPSSHSGHVILLGLSEDEFPGAKQIEEWPSWNLPILKWGRAQGAVVGYAHSGSGMWTGSDELPNDQLPAFANVGANEAIVDVTHGALDFLGGCEYDPAAELNTWYHLLNCGFRPVFAGETDYPCISDERPGVGRSYARLDRPPRDEAGYRLWVEALRAGRLYSGDGRSHILEFVVAGTSPGFGDLAFDDPRTVHVSALVAAYLEAEPGAEAQGIRASAPFERPTWHIERARIGETREVSVELIINGAPVESRTLLADGQPRVLTFSADVQRSAWVALRLLPSSHSHPVFIEIGGKPIRASRRSARWLRQSVDRLWDVKHRMIRSAERAAASEAYDQARRTYDAIFAECSND